MFRKIFTLFLIIIPGILLAQIRDSSIVIPMISIGMGGDIPGGDMARRFGPDLTAGISFSVKTKKQWIWGLEGNIIFSDRLRETGIFDSISTSQGTILNMNGEYAKVKMQEHGFFAGIKVGKIIPKWGPNPNSGLMFSGSAGFMQHRIWIVNEGNNTPQIMKNYKKGYDRLTNGFALQEFLGYMYLNNRGTFNMYGGFVFTQGFTRSRRIWDFDLMRQDTEKRLDLLWGIKLGWILPIYRKMSTDYYYY